MGLEVWGVKLKMEDSKLDTKRSMPQPPNPKPQAPGPSAIYIPGMAGEKWMDRRFLAGLMKAGVRTQTLHWTRFRLPLRNLRDRRQHEQAATRLLAMVRALRRERPDEPIALIGHSTGCLIVLEALERREEPVEAAVLMAAAVSSGYDLRPALRSVNRLIHISSRLDTVFLGIGTMLFGTADGHHSASAGFLGFRGPGRDDPRFIQHVFRIGWLMHLHHGGHIGCLQPRFARRVIAPLLSECETRSPDSPSRT